MTKGTRLAVSIILTSVFLNIVAAGIHYWVQPVLTRNTEQIRWQHAPIRVSASNLSEVDKDAVEAWGIPVVFVTEDADVSFHYGNTGPEQYVEGFGTLYAAGVTTPEVSKWMWITGCDIVLNHRVESMEGVDRSPVITHEFGHCLGLAHDEAEGSIMGPKAGMDLFSPVITDNDRRVLSRKYHV